MTTPTISVDPKRAVRFLGNERSVPILVNGAEAVAVFQDADYAKLMSLSTKIRERNAAHTDSDSIVWSVSQAVEDGLLRNGVIRIGREHV